jgi:V8-like Glu-specific endopeptidase
VVPIELRGFVGLRDVLKVVLPSAVIVGVTLAGGAAVVAWNSAQADDASATGQSVSAADAAATESYWTPQTMAQATPLGERTTQAKGLTALAATGRTAKAFGGLKTVGVLFFTTSTAKKHYCTASVINGGHGNLLITAAHCLYGSGGYRKHVAFVPKYDAGKEPYGIWTAKRLTVTSGWKKSRDKDLDFGFIALNKRSGKQIKTVTGTNVLAINTGYRNWVNVDGYPMVAYAKSDHPIYCRNWTKKKFKYTREFDCAGYYGGTSGSPFLWHENYGAGTGKVVGVIGGYQEGGDVDYISYSSIFDKDVWNLRAAAAKTS